MKESTDNEEHVEIQSEYNEHQEEARVRYEEKKKDKLQSTNSDTRGTKVIMLYLQKCLPTPLLSNNQSFYSLKLWTYNLTIYDATEKRSYSMVWNEHEAGRGGNEISSALMKWAEMHLKDIQSCDHLIIWTDNCPSRNRNSIMMVSYIYLLKLCPYLKVVEHKFLLRGHTHMEVDHVHALFERQIKGKRTGKIVTSWDWEQLIREAGVTVYKMELDDFKNVETLLTSNFTNRKLNTIKEKFLISKVVNFCVKKEDKQGTINYRVIPVSVFTARYKQIL